MGVGGGGPGENNPETYCSGEKMFFFDIRMTRWMNPIITLKILSFILIEVPCSFFQNHRADINEASPPNKKKKQNGEFQIHLHQSALNISGLIFSCSYSALWSLLRRKRKKKSQSLR